MEAWVQRLIESEPNLEQAPKEFYRFGKDWMGTETLKWGALNQAPCMFYRYGKYWSGLNDFLTSKVNEMLEKPYENLERIQQTIKALKELGNNELLTRPEPYNVTACEGFAALT